jgi:deoxyribodipyrimidine photo-lyase
MSEEVVVFWFRRDLRLEDNKGLFKALSENKAILPIFIFDDNILSELYENDPRVNFIYDSLKTINNELTQYGSGVTIIKGDPLIIWKELINSYSITQVYTNKDYEPYAIKRDQEIQIFLHENNIGFNLVKDQVIFEENEVVKDNGTPYTVYTPYKNKWLKHFDKSMIAQLSIAKLTGNLYNYKYSFPSKEELNIKENIITVKPYNLTVISKYDEYRNFPAQDKTSYLSPHLRFGTVSVRKLVGIALAENAIFLSELIWREFFMQILFHFPKVVTHNFKAKYDTIEWRNNEQEFQKWCDGKTGYPIVDAGMRELNETGYMHNRVRMITAGFLCKHLLIDWRWGEAYFAKKLLDYELSANNGNWQWSAGTGCDSAPYFRIFNPHEQIKKFDKGLVYINKWVKDLNELNYPQPIVEHKLARERALETYKIGLSKN